MPAAGGALDPQGAEARTIADLWWLMVMLGAAVFVLFAVLLAVGLFRKRPAAPGDDGTGDHADDEAEARSERRWLLGGGVAMPLVLLLVVLVATIAAMRSVGDDVPDGALVVEVVGHQWWWEIRYPADGVVTANELHLPVGRPVALRLSSADVIHSFWVPALGGKKDLLPDGVNTLVLRADRPGRHLSQCAEFCGLQHTKMALTVVVESAAEFATWVQDRRAPAVEQAGDAARRGRELFASAGCASCHTVRGTPAAGIKGPDLTHVASRPTLAASSLANTADNLAEFVRDPHRIKEGLKMPAPELTPAEREAVLAYLGTLR